MKLVAAAALATLADLATFLVMVDRHGLAAELNPIVRELAALSLLAAAAVKVLIVVILVAWGPAVGRMRRPVLTAGVLVGVLGATSNVRGLLG